MPPLETNFSDLKLITNTINNNLKSIKLKTKIDSTDNAGQKSKKLCVNQNCDCTHFET